MKKHFSPVNLAALLVWFSGTSEYYGFYWSCSELYVEVVRGNFLCDQDYKPLPELYYNEYK